ncbi:fimbrial protein [Providencia sp. Me31A]|uniref:fimbrial protein n=1 Tax=Providencia sp. Me31A TaxID=3392637 RepID=UPI003D2B2F4D
MGISITFKKLLLYISSLLPLLSVAVVTHATPQAIGYRAMDSWAVDGQHGILRVKGMLTDSPCRLAMHSTDQTLDLGTVTRGDFPTLGAKGRAVSFQLELTDCLAVANARMDRQTGQIPWSKSQPAVSVQFMAVNRDASQRYVALQGISGVGLEIKDERGDILPLGQYSVPRLLAVGQSALIYTVTPVRITGPFLPGAFYAVIGFQLSYD